MSPTKVSTALGQNVGSPGGTTRDATTLYSMPSPKRGLSPLKGKDYYHDPVKEVEDNINLEKEKCEKKYEEQWQIR